MLNVGFQFLNSFSAISTTFCKLFKWKISFLFCWNGTNFFSNGNRSSTKLKHTEELRLTVLREKEFYIWTLIDGWTILNVSEFLKFIFFEEKKTFSNTYVKRNKIKIKLLLYSLNKLYLAFYVNMDNSRGATGIFFWKYPYSLN